MPIRPHLTRSTRWISRALLGRLAVLAVVAAMVSACQAGPTPPAATPPPPPCVEPTLTLGTTKFVIKPIARAADGSLTLPSDNADTAYWVDGTNVNYVFALGPAAKNLALKDALPPGTAATIAWADCSTDEYVVKSIEAGVPEQSVLYDQSHGGLTVFVPGGASGQGLTITSARPQASAAETPSPTEANAIQADMAFLGNTTSPDGKSVQITVAMTNTGTTPFSLTISDISLTPENAASLAPSRVEPSLPQTIQPGAGATFSITFPHPGVSTAVLKILTFSLDYYF
jgi:hypothetical protein